MKSNGIEYVNWQGVVVNSFQNCIFRDEKQPKMKQLLSLLVVNSFQNCIFRDEKQRCSEITANIGSCE